MPNNVADLYVSKFNVNLVLLAQQMISRFRQWVETGTHHGKQASPVDQIGETVVQKRTSRFAPKDNTDIEHFRRWVEPDSFHTHTLFDNFDKIRMNVNPSSKYLKAQMKAMNRQMDDNMIASHFGDAKTGEEGGTTTTFTAEGAGTIAAGAADLTVAKLLAARKLLFENEVDIDDPESAIVCGITPKQEETLINQTEINNADFGNTVFGINGTGGKTLKSWFGINFVITNRLLDGAGIRATENPGASATREIPFYAMSGMHLGLWEDLKGVIVQRHDLVHDPIEMSVYATFGATRLEGVKMVKIICDET